MELKPLLLIIAWAGSLAVLPVCAAETHSELLSRYCVDCHSGDDPEAGVRLDQIDVSAELASGGKTFERIRQVITAYRMPPEDADPLPEDLREQMQKWAENEIVGIERRAKQLGLITRNRRLTRDEYNFTMQSLFGVDAEFADLLPPDPLSERGYSNDSGRLGWSSIQIESYLDSARRAVERYVTIGEPRSETVRYHVELEDLFYYTADRYGTRERAPQPIDDDEFLRRRDLNRESAPVYVDPLTPRVAGAYSDDEKLRPAIPKLHQQFLALPKRLAVGELIVRVRAAGTRDRRDRPPRLRVEAGITQGDGCSVDKRSLGEVDVTADANSPAVYEFRMRLEDVPSKAGLNEATTFDRLSVFDMDQIFLSNVTCDEKAMFGLGRGGYADAEKASAAVADKVRQLTDDRVALLHLDCVEIELVSGADEANQPYRWHVPGVDSASSVKVIKQFMREAYRRPVSLSEVDAKVSLYSRLQQQGFSPAESLRETLVAVLVSPAFLFLESDGEHRNSILASRLSYFLWSSPPDPGLVQLSAEEGPWTTAFLRETASRMLDDRRSDRFLQSFCQQWLRLDKHENVSVDRARYGFFDDDLAALSFRETIATFIDVFRSRESALDLLDCDYAILNDRLAEHYGMRGLTGGDLRRVKLPEASVRGGLLSQASLLTINSDGSQSHPIRRGVWLLDRLLNRPSPPPPPDVPEIESAEEDGVALTLRERIAKHREPGSCQNCHREIDPWGIAMENFDAVGRWRDDAEASSVLSGGEAIDGMAELKRHLREAEHAAFADALVYHMVTYAIGRKPGYTDAEQLARISARFVESDYQLRELVLAIVESELFRK